MNYAQLLHALREFFNDTSRSPAETKEGLLDIAMEAKTLAESIPEEADEEDGA